MPTNTAARVPILATIAQRIVLRPWSIISPGHLDAPRSWHGVQFPRLVLIPKCRNRHAYFSNRQASFELKKAYNQSDAQSAQRLWVFDSARMDEEGCRHGRAYPFRKVE